MSEQSRQSNNQSATGGRDSLSPSPLRANSKLLAQRQQYEQKTAVATGEIIQNLTPRFRTSEPPELVKSSGVPLRHCRLTHEMEQHGEWKANRDKLCGRIGSGFLVALIGNRGTGKTQMSVHAVVYNSKTQRRSLYCKAMEIFLDIRATYTRPDASEKDAIAKYLEPSLLVIDEIQQRGETAFEDRLLAYLIDKRYDAMVDTILIGNLQEDAFKDSLDPSIVDRLRETGGILQCNWKSFRQGG